MTPFLIESFQRADTTTLARWYSQLNSWIWPDELKELKSEGFDKLPDYNKEHIGDKFTLIKPLINLLKDMVGEKELSRYHHLQNLHNTNEYFEGWWKATKEGRFDKFYHENHL